MGQKSARYEDDFYAWSQEQAALLRAGALDRADLAHLAEEIESMGKTEKRELINRLTVLLMHLIKWRFQPMMRGRSWRLSVEGQRIDVTDLLEENPSLRPLISASIQQAWKRALIDAERETGLEASAFPTSCPWSIDDILSPDFWPEG